MGILPSTQFARPRWMLGNEVRRCLQERERGAWPHGQCRTTRLRKHRAPAPTLTSTQVRLLIFLRALQRSKTGRSKPSALFRQGDCGHTGSLTPRRYHIASTQNIRRASHSSITWPANLHLSFKLPLRIPPDLLAHGRIEQPIRLHDLGRQLLLLRVILEQPSQFHVRLRAP